MTPEQWQRIRPILESALELDPDRRASFLAEACPDSVLHAEIESLIAAHQLAGASVLDPGSNFGHEADSPGEAEPSLLGKTVSRYIVLEKLGGGGMGVVYKARDTQLGRLVALKFLRTELSKDPLALERLKREARAASALDHPNIVTIHEIGEQNGRTFIVMERVVGRPLNELIPRTGMRLTEALGVAAQVAGALTAAHAAGIVHRDLKPANIMVDAQGRVKVLDFGLAKRSAPAVTVAAGAGEAVDTLTVDQPATEEGIILGSVPYMSPEQAEGKPLDARSDIFSFGAVLYEMITGQRAFRGESRASTLAAVVEKEPPPLNQISSTTPPELDRLVARCLRKDVHRRSQHMADVKLALDELRADSESSAKRTAPRRGWWWAVAAVICITAAGVFSILRPSGGSTESALREAPLTSNPGIERSPSFSPDGNQVAFAWNGEKQDNLDIYVKLIGPGAPLRLTTNPADDDSPAWSPDGRTIAFLREVGAERFEVYAIPALGGPERKLVDIFLPGKRVGWLSAPFLAWLPDSKGIIFCHKDSPEHPPSLFLFRTDTYERRQLTFPTAGSDGDSAAALSPDGSALVFARASGILPFDLYRLALTKEFAPAGEPERITHDNSPIGGVTWSSSAREIVYSLFDGLWRIPFSRFGGRPGKPQRIEPIGHGFSPAVSREGRRLAFVRTSGGDLDIWRAAIPDFGKSGGKSTPSIAPARFISSTRAEFAAQYSPDGNKIAFESERGGSLEIWVCQSDSSKCVQMTSFGGHLTGVPHWSPDGRRISFYHRVNEKAQIFTVNAEGGPSQRLTDDAYDEFYSNWSRDGRWIYFSSNRSGIDQVWKMPSAGGPAAQMTRNGGWAMAESPDGKYLYYTRSRDPNSGLWRIPAEGGPESRVLESIVTHNFAVTNRGLYFMVRTDRHDKYAIRFLNSADRKTYSIAAFDGDTYHCLSVSPDERWLLYAVATPGGSNVMLVENFK